MKLQAILALGLLVLSAVLSAARARHSPVIFIPGKGGSQIEARINKDASENILPECETLTPWFRIWLDVWHFLWPGRLACWAENMQLHYDKETGTSKTTRGVDFRIPGWGDTHSVEYVDDSWTAYLMGNFAAYLIFVTQELSNWGYTRGKDIRAAPYDFRFAPHSQADYFERLKELVEETYRINDNTRVTLLTHSLGGIYGQYFLHTVSHEWKDEFIHAFVPVNSPWKGTVMISNLYTSGYNWGITPIDRDVLKLQQRTWETGVLLLPHADAWDEPHVLVSTPERNYTANDYHQFFEDIEYPLGKELYENIQHRSYDMAHPAVDTYCVYSYGLDTPDRLVYDQGEFPDGDATMLMGPGDGTVNLVSLEYCQEWVKKHDDFHVADVLTYEKVPHIDLLFDPQFFKDFKKIVNVDE